MKLYNKKIGALDNKFPNFSSLNKKNLNKISQSNDFNRKNNLSRNKFNQTYYNFPISKKNINIFEQIKKYHQNPHLRINLKIIGEGLKQKILEMTDDEIDIVDKKEISSPLCATKYAKSLMKKYDFKLSGNINKSIKINSDKDNKNKKKKRYYIQQKDNNELPKNKSELGNSDEPTNNSSNNIKLNINKKKDKIFNKSDFIRNKMDKFRIIKRKQILYDSLCDDNDLEKDNDQYKKIINPETNFIYYFDLFIILAYFYIFFIITFNLANAECLCILNDKIQYKDILLFIIDILYILDLLISFFRCYYNFELKLIKSNILIIKNYLKGDFCLDLIEAIPLFIINKYICTTHNNLSFCYKYEVNATFFILKMANFFKILKVIKILGIKKNQALDFFLELISKYYNIERTFLLILDAMIYIGIIHCFV